MVSKYQRKQILQLKQKKYRYKWGLFVAEGEKVVEELLRAGWKYHFLFTTKEPFHPDAIKINSAEMKQITHFKTSSPVLGVFEMAQPKPFQNAEVTIALDGITDPGNLGTLIRLCDWFGIDELVCSSTTVDWYNSKVVQATMGSLTRVNCLYEEDLAGFLKSLGKTIIAADAGGTSLYKATHPTKACYVFGSESHGLSEEIKKVTNTTLAIPNQRALEGAESLNVASATAVFLSELFRDS
ncbi:MAG: TrmH family RNA methyltransferase [Flavobacteriaceae bacterium]